MNRRDQVTGGVSALSSRPRPAQPHGEESLAPGSVRPLEFESGVAAQIQDLVAAGSHQAARDLFGQIVGRQQRRASRIAWHYLHDAADADEAAGCVCEGLYPHRVVPASSLV